MDLKSNLFNKSALKTKTIASFAKILGKDTLVSCSGACCYPLVSCSYRV